MPVTKGKGKKNLALGVAAFGGDYRTRVLNTGPIAYWMQDELTGTVSYCQVNPAQNGAYAGVTLGQPGIGDGRTSPFFDAVNDLNNIHSASFAGAFDGEEGTVMAWGRVFNAGVWTDGSNRFLLTIAADASNILTLRKSSVNNTILWVYEADGTVESHSVAAYSNLAYFSMGMTWSRTADEVHYYLDGVHLTQDIALGAWVGALSATDTVIGAQNTGGAQEWHGYSAHIPVWDRALSPAVMLSLGVL